MKLEPGENDDNNNVDPLAHAESGGTDAGSDGAVDGDAWGNHNVIAVDKAGFLKAAQDHFAGEVQGGMNTYAFDDAQNDQDEVQGASFWRKLIIEHGDDYAHYASESGLFHREVDAIPPGKISPHLPDHYTLIDLGPGSLEAVDNKTIPLIEILANNHKAMAGYIAVDVNESFAEDAAERIYNKYHVSHAESYARDFLHRKMSFVGDVENPVFLLTGGLFCNAPINTHGPDSAESTITSYFNRIAAAVPQGGTFIISNELPPEDAGRMTSSYANNNLAGNIMSILYKIKRDLPTQDFDPHKFRFDSEYDAERQNNALSVIATEDQHFSIGDEEFDVKAGEKFTLVNSLKFQVKPFRKLAEQAGLRSLATEFSDDRRIALHIFRIPPQTTVNAPQPTPG